MVPVLVSSLNAVDPGVDVNVVVTLAPFMYGGDAKTFCMALVVGGSGQMNHPSGDLWRLKGHSNSYELGRDAWTF